MGRWRIDGEQIKQSNEYKSVIRVDKENEQLYQAVIPDFVDGGSREELEDKDQLLWAPHKGLRTATVNKFLREWKLKRDGMDDEDLDFTQKKFDKSETEDSEGNRKNMKKKRKSKKIEDSEIDDAVRQPDPIISRFLKNRDDDLALFALLSSDRKTAEALKLSLRKKDESKNDFEPIVKIVEGRERKRSVRRQSLKEKKELETPDRQKRKEERDKARERAEMEEWENDEEENMVVLQMDKSKVVIDATIEEREKRVADQEAEVAAKVKWVEQKEKDLHERQRAIEDREKSIKNRQAKWKPLMKVTANKFMERITITEEIENVRPEHVISSNAVKLALEGNSFDEIRQIEQEAALLLEDLLVTVVRQAEEKEFLKGVEQKTKMMETVEKEFLCRQLALEKKEQAFLERESQNSAFMEMEAKILGDPTIPFENKMQEMTDLLKDHPTLMNAVKHELLTLQNLYEKNVQEISEKDAPNASSMNDDDMVSCNQFALENNEQSHPETQKTTMSVTDHKKSGNEAESVHKEPSTMEKPEEEVEVGSQEEMDLISDITHMADDNAQNIPQEESACENNETLPEGLISRSAKRKESQEDSDYISPKKQRKSSSNAYFDENNNFEYPSLLDSLLDETDEEDTAGQNNEVSEESFIEDKDLSQVQPSVYGGKNNVKSSVRRGRPSCPSKGSILDERLNEKPCAPEELLNIDKINKENLHEHLHMRPESSEEKLENLKFLARYGIIYNEHLCVCTAPSTLVRSRKSSKKCDGYHWNCSSCIFSKCKQGVQVSVRYKCMFESWKQPIATILMAAAKLIDNPLDLDDIAKSLSKQMKPVLWERHILDVIQLVVVDGATREELGGPDKIVDMERAYLHAEKFMEPYQKNEKKQNRTREECIIFMERESTAYSIVRVTAFDQTTVTDAVASRVREGTKIASNVFDLIGGTTEAQAAFDQLHPDKDIRFYKCAAREVSWNGSKNWKAVEDLYRRASKTNTHRADLTLLYVLNRMFPKPFNAFLYGLTKYDSSNPLL